MRTFSKQGDLRESNTIGKIKNEMAGIIHSFRTVCLTENADFPALKELQQIIENYDTLAIQEISR